MTWTSELRAALANLSDLKRCLRAETAAAYSELGLGEAQMKILRQVAETPGMTQADLARAIATDPALMGRALRGLISRGALRRKRSTVDARAYVIELGPRGLALLERVNEASAKLVERVSVLLDTRDLVDFDRIAKKLIAGLGEGSGAGDRDAAAAHKAKRSARKRA